ncbi:hypothetical protein [Gracilibacillus thailandensis]|uniref:hypothetical protein n=2 Tax=Gracilibacillus thailandensis TaxID=563735 RepID=UPI0036F21194
MFCWVITAYMLYTIMTGKTIGTKTSQRVQAFDRDHMGEKRWKRKTLTEALILSVLSIILTVCLFVLDFDFVQLDFPISVFPLIGPWIGFNIGEIVRMNNL